MILAKDLNYGDSSSLSQQIAEVSKLLESYLCAIIDSNH